MTKRRALFVDLDGTIYDNHIYKGIMPSTKKALLNLQDDVDLYLATGRSSFTLSVIDEILPLFKGFLLVNGQQVIYEGKNVYYNIIDPKLIKKLYIESAKDQIPLGLVALDKAYVYAYSEDVHRFFSNRSNDKIVDCGIEGFDFNIPISMAWVFSTGDVIDSLAQRVPELNFLKWGRFGCDVVTKGESKERGIKVIQAIGNYALEDMYAIGNGDNDIEMFNSVGVAIAMGNSNDKVKENAHHVTSDIGDDGFYQALKKVGLLKN